MSTSTFEVSVPEAEAVTASGDTLTAELSDGRTLSVPLDWFPRLVHATPEERGNWRLIGRGAGIHWPDLDEDISVEGLIAGRRSTESQASFLRWLEARHSATPSASRTEIAMIKVCGAKMLFNAIDRSIQVHGTMGYSADMPLEEMYRNARASRLVDGADEVHKVSIARRTLKEHSAVDGHPTEHIPTRRAAALERFADHLDIEAMNS